MFRTLLHAAVAVFVSVAASLSAQENDWKEVHKDQKQTVFVRVSSVQPTKMGVMAWVKTVFNSPQEFNGLSAPIKFTMDKSEFSKTSVCIRRQIMYDINDNKIVDHSGKPDELGMEIIPDTIGDITGKQVWNILKSKQSTKYKKNK